MRFALTLANETRQILPLNYQYPLSAWIYKVFNRADRHFAEWLHEHGYLFNGNRRFKLFTFSNLQLEKAGLVNTRTNNAALEVFPGSNKLLLSFYMEEAASHFITGLFRDQELVIADNEHKARFRVTMVEQPKIPEFSSTMNFRCLSPVVLSRPEARGDRLLAVYLDPGYPDYPDLLKENLLKRYMAAHNEVLAGIERNGTVDERLADLPFDTGNWNFKLLSKPLSKLQTIKAGTPAQTKVRGHAYEFELNAPPKLMDFAYHAGLGEKGSLGYGCLEVMRKF